MCLLLILNDVFRWTTPSPGPISRTYLYRSSWFWPKIQSCDSITASQRHEWSSIVFYPVVCCWSVGSPPGPSWTHLKVSHTRFTKPDSPRVSLLRSNSRNCYLRKNSVTNRSHRFGSISNNCCRARRQLLMPLCCENSSSNICHPMRMYIVAPGPVSKRILNLTTESHWLCRSLEASYSLVYSSGQQQTVGLCSLQHQYWSGISLWMVLTPPAEALSVERL